MRREAELGVAIARRIGDVQLLGEQLSCLAMAAVDEQESRCLRLEALACCRRAGDDLLAANVLQHLYGLDLVTGQLADANDYLEQAVDLAEQLGADLFLYFLQSDLGILRLIQERYAEAVPLIRRSLQIARRTGMRIDTSQLVLGAACCIAWQGDYDRAARLHGAADCDLSQSIELGSIKWSAPEQGMREREQRKLRELMGDGPYEAAYRSGAGLTRAQAVELALNSVLPTWTAAPAA